jgi:Ni/Fe-hydrogenase subunit HybB-like protein
MSHAQAQPVGGNLFTRNYLIVAALAALGLGLIVWRFVVGLGTATALSDGYPWGLWIAYDVVTGTALACGGYAMAFLVYIFNKGRYHPLVRPAILTSALGYTMAGLSVVIDVGRPWLIWKVPLFAWSWNLNSALLEVALCIMAYVFVLWIELSPAFFERWVDTGKWPWLRRFSQKALRFMDKALIWIIALGMLLPTMHQSSLGSLMLLSGPRLHPLWNTPWLPFFFLVTCVAMGYAVVVFETTLSSRGFKLASETSMLALLQRVAAWGTAIFVVLRVTDLAVRGQAAAMVRLDLYGTMFWIENLLYLVPLLLLAGGRAYDATRLFRSAMALALAGGLYRFDTYLLAFDPGPGWHYFPSVPELFTTLGIVALEIAIYVAVVRYFPILAGRPQAGALRPAAAR